MISGGKNSAELIKEIKFLEASLGAELVHEPSLVWNQETNWQGLTKLWSQ